ncbi:MAG: prenyltransferase/squalene oxidase repeat-containing protein [Solirubrobacteraceae bacterium]
MSWPLATFAIVFGVLLAGWLAYERSRPSARLTAVVGTLAAVAALGRDAFVALPDVKPITAMTFVVGYALGPLPGFAVGAIGMLASNIVLGQGPYTPWQMAAWGLVGLAGAGLGRLTRRRMGRFGIALACGVSALGAKEIMNVYTWTIGASHTPAALVATASVALPFDVTDVIASFLFGLAFGPELARLLGRMRARMDVHWEAVSTAPLALLLLAVAGACATISPAQPARAMSAHASARGPVRTVARRRVESPSARASVKHVDISPEVSYLVHAQNRDGGFGGAREERSSELYSAWVAMGLAAAGRGPLSVTRAGHSVLDSIRTEASTLEGAGDEERTILALHASGASVHLLPGGDPLGKLMSERASDGSFGQLVNTTTFAIFALRAAGRSVSDPVVRAAGRWLVDQQSPDGGFSFATRGASEDVDDTAAALQGVIDAEGQGSPAARRAVAFLRHAQDPDGGYAQQAGGASNAQSTAWAVQGLIAADQDVNAVTRGGSRSPLAYIESLVAPDGSVRYSRTSAQTPVWVTAQALIALAGKPFPIGPVPRRPIARHAVAPSVGAHLHVASTGSHTTHVARIHAVHAQRARPKAKAKDLASVPGVSIAAQGRLEAIARTAGVLVGVVLEPMLR